MNPDYLKIRKRIYRKRKYKRLFILRPFIVFLLCGVVISLLFYGIRMTVTAGSPPTDTVSTGRNICPLPQKEENSALLEPYEQDRASETKSENYPEVLQTSNSLESEKAEEFFKGALFIGDSRTEGLAIYSDLPDTDFYAKKGLTVENIFTDAFIQEAEGRLTVLQALSQDTFSEIYVMLGINELGWQYETVFIEQYEKLVEEIQERQPSANLYIQSILPVTKEKSENDPYVNQERINRYNILLQQLAEKKKVKYIPVEQALCTEEGFLPKEASVDGVHLNRKYCEKWVNALQKMVYQEKKKVGDIS